MRATGEPAVTTGRPEPETRRSDRTLSFEWWPSLNNQSTKMAAHPPTRRPNSKWPAPTHSNKEPPNQMTDRDTDGTKSDDEEQPSETEVERAIKVLTKALGSDLKISSRHQRRRQTHDQDESTGRRRDVPIRSLHGVTGTTTWTPAARRDPARSHYGTTRAPSWTSPPSRSSDTHRTATVAP